MFSQHATASSNSQDPGGQVPALRPKSRSYARSGSPRARPRGAAAGKKKKASHPWPRTRPRRRTTTSSATRPPLRRHSTIHGRSDAAGNYASAIRLLARILITCEWYPLKAPSFFFGHLQCDLRERWHVRCYVTNALANRVGAFTPPFADTHAPVSPGRVGQRVGAFTPPFTEAPPRHRQHR